jgi:preprotein translocase subunit SecE
MNAKADVENSALDNAKLGLAVLLVAGGIAVFYHFDQYSLLLRVLGLLVVMALAAGVALQSAVGRRIWRFAADARTEVRKVVWPTRQETIQMTLVVFVMVLIMALILWAFDMALLAIVRQLTGQGG